LSLICQPRASATIIFAIGASVVPGYAALAGSCAKEIAKLEHAMDAFAAKRRAARARWREARRRPLPTSGRTGLCWIVLEHWLNKATKLVVQPPWRRCAVGTYHGRVQSFFAVAELSKNSGHAS
jgi:hypothetical protein